MSNEISSSAYDLLIRILENTKSETLDELWPDTDITMTDIARDILNRHASQLCASQKDRPDVVLNKVRKIYGFSAPDVDHVWSTVYATADLINPETEQ